MREEYEHPDITRVLRTGEVKPHPPLCADCGLPAEPGGGEDGSLFLFGGELLCGDCLRERAGGMDARELAVRLGCAEVAF